MKKYRVTIEYIAKDHTEHTLQGTFSSLNFALVKAKSTCLKDDIDRVKKVLVEEI